MDKLTHLTFYHHLDKSKTSNKVLGEFGHYYKKRLATSFYMKRTEKGISFQKMVLLVGGVVVLFTLTMLAVMLLMVYPNAVMYLMVGLALSYLAEFTLVAFVSTSWHKSANYKCVEYGLEDV